MAAVAAVLVFPATVSAAVSAADTLESEAININPNPQYAEGVPHQWQCLVCHADPKLKDDKVLKSLYFSREDVLKSAHLKVGCAGCHTNYTTAPEKDHERISKADSKKFTAIARASCTKCKDHADEVALVKKSAHGTEPSLEATTDQPKCKDCHDFHDMYDRQKDKVYAEDRHMMAQEICGKCHKKQWASYNDYYHGRAYKAGDVRAPACWDCHTPHSVMFGDEESSVSKEHLKKTCGKCHDNIDDTFLTYTKLIHGHDALFKENPVVAWITRMIKKLLPKAALKVEA